MAMTRPGFWKDLWALLVPYWQAKDPAQIELRVWRRSLLRLPASERFIAWGLLLLVIALTLGVVYMNVQFNSWYKAFYDSLQDKNADEFYYQMIRFMFLASLWIVIVVYSSYINQMLQIRWRRWMTERYLKEWLAQRTYYRMQLTGSSTDNPDQRIAEDMKMFVDETLGLSLGLLNAVVSLVAFSAILWSLSGPITLPIGAHGIVIPGYMLWAAVIYCAVATLLTHKIGKPLIGLNFNQQRFEADFRFSLARFRENVEGVALYRGEEDELQGFFGRFRRLADNWWTIIMRQKLLTWFTAGQSQLAVVFPYLVAAPRYFSGAIPLGGLMQVGNAFGEVRVALSWFINAYTGTGPNTGFVGWKATVDRLTGFHNAVVSAQERQRSEPGVALEAGEGSALKLEQMELALPSGERLVTDANATIPSGSRVLIRGPSGSGKSTLFRAIAGIWPFGKGRVKLPVDFRALFLPQRPYFPLGTLREAVSYPASGGSFSDEQVHQALGDVGLPHLTDRLDEVANWSMQLSGGEQQRVAFARALLHEPRWLFLDEPTSNLDVQAEAALYRLLCDRLRSSTIVSIAHRPELAAFHGRQIELRPDGAAGSKLIAESALA